MQINFKKINFVLLFNITLCLCIIVNGVFIRGEREFRESSWLISKVESVKCKTSRRSEHTLKFENNKKHIIVLINDLSCNDLKQLIKYEKINVYVDYGYSDVGYSSEIKTTDRTFKRGGNKSHIYDGKHFNGFERLILLVLAVYFLTRFFKYLREEKLTIK